MQDSSKANLVELINQLPFEARMNVIQEGFIIHGLDDYEGLLVMESVDHPNYNGAAYEEYKCFQCKNFSTISLNYWWAPDDGTTLHDWETMCTPCMVKLFETGEVVGLTEQGLRQFLIEIQQLGWTLSTNGWNKPEPESEPMIKRCRFEDEDVHAHRISKADPARRQKEMSGLDNQDAWLVCSETSALLVASPNRLHGWDEDPEFFESLAEFLANQNLLFDCGKRLETVRNFAEGYINIDEEAAYYFVMSTMDAANYLITTDLKELNPNQHWAVF